MHELYLNAIPCVSKYNGVKNFISQSQNLPIIGNIYSTRETIKLILHVAIDSLLVFSPLLAAIVALKKPTGGWGEVSIRYSQSLKVCSLHSSPTMEFKQLRYAFTQGQIIFA